MSSIITISENLKSYFKAEKSHIFCPTDSAKMHLQAIP